MLDTQQLMFTRPDFKPPRNLPEPQSKALAPEEAAPGCTYGEQTGGTQPGTKADSFQTQTEMDGGAGASGSQLWPSRMEMGGDASGQNRLLNDANKFLLSPAVEQQEFTDINHHLQHQAKEEAASDGYPVVAMSSSSCDLTRLQQVKQEFQFMAADGGADGGVDATITCSSCRQNFQNFNSFQGHECGNVHVQQTFCCEICGKMFNQRAVLNLHLKFHELKDRM